MFSSAVIAAFFTLFAVITGLTASPIFPVLGSFFAVSYIVYVLAWRVCCASVRKGQAGDDYDDDDLASLLDNLSLDGDTSAASVSVAQAPTPVPSWQPISWIRSSSWPPAFPEAWEPTGASSQPHAVPFNFWTAYVRSLAPPAKLVRQDAFLCEANEALTDTTLSPEHDFAVPVRMAQYRRAGVDKALAAVNERRAAWAKRHAYWKAMTLKSFKSPLLQRSKRAVKKP